MILDMEALAPIYEKVDKLNLRLTVTFSRAKSGITHILCEMRQRNGFVIQAERIDVIDGEDIDLEEFIGRLNRLIARVMKHGHS